MLITFEGIEGCGKSTQAELLKDCLIGAGVKTLLSREPGGSPLGEKLRTILLNRENYHLTPESELFLYLADRAEHVWQVIKPALEENKILIVDRYLDSTLVYQGYGRGFDLFFVQELNTMATYRIWPQITFLLDLPPDQGLKRARTRNLENFTDIEEGRFESEDLAFHQTIRNGYLEIAKHERDRFVVLDAMETVESVFENIKEYLFENVLTDLDSCYYL